MTDATTAIVSLEIDGVYLDAWGEYTVTLDLLRPGSPWTFALWRTDTERSTWAAADAAVKIGARCTLSIDGAVVLDGFVRGRKLVHSAGNGAQLVVSGVDLVGVCAGAHADPTLSFKGVALQTAIERLLQPVSVAVEFGEAVDPLETTRGLRPPRRPRRRPARRPGRVDSFRPRIGESVWDCVEALARRAGYLAWVQPSSTPDRTVVRIDKPRDSGEASFGLLWAWDETGSRAAQGSNVLTAEDDLDAAGVPTSVTVFADTPRGDAVSARIARTVDNDAFVGQRFAFITQAAPRYVLSARARSVDAARREATRAIGDANAGLNTYTCTVQGHTQERGGVRYLYAINELAIVRDELTGRDETMLVTSVRFDGTPGSQTTTLKLVPVGAIKCDPQEV